MSLTGRPSSPPFLLVSSAQICIASSPEVPLTASPPVSGMLNPIVIGVPAGASALTGPLTSSIKIAEANPSATFPSIPFSQSLIRHPRKHHPHDIDLRADVL